jgi:hypothetical protein
MLVIDCFLLTVAERACSDLAKFDVKKKMQPTTNNGILILFYLFHI